MAEIDAISNVDALALTGSSRDPGRRQNGLAGQEPAIFVGPTVRPAAGMNALG
jgi:hypothetical protein